MKYLSYLSYLTGKKSDIKHVTKQTSNKIQKHKPVTKLNNTMTQKQTSKPNIEAETNRKSVINSKPVNRNNQ